MKKLFSKRNLFIAAGIVSVLVLGICILLKFTFIGQIVKTVMHKNPGPFDRKKMEAIVEQVRLAKMNPGEEREFKLDDLSDPKSIRLLKPETYFEILLGAGHVWASESSEGKLTVVIETNDMGHAGEYGFAYSDEPLKPVPSPNYPGSTNLDVPGLLNEPIKKIDDHWWAVRYSLG